MQTIIWRFFLMMIVSSSAIVSGMRPPFQSELPSGEREVISTSTRNPCEEKKHKKSHNSNLINEVQEFYVEHHISEPNARKAAKEMSLDIDFEDTIGCDKCTEEENEYCLGPGIIDDHCCCDGRFTEDFGFMAHTCYKGDIICRPVRKDCEEYTRIRDCCCKSLLKKRWKSRFQNTSTSIHEREVVRWTWTLLTSLATYLFVVNLY